MVLCAECVIPVGDRYKSMAHILRIKPVDGSDDTRNSRRSQPIVMIIIIIIINNNNKFIGGPAINIKLINIFWKLFNILCWQTVSRIVFHQIGTVILFIIEFKFNTYIHSIQIHSTPTVKLSG